MIRQAWYEYGDVFALRILFDQRGEGLAMHKHPPGHEHSVMVLRGSVRLSTRASECVWPGTDVAAPCIIDVLPEWHEITALEPGTELFNLYKHGKPAEYAELPDSEKDVRFESRPLENPLEDGDESVSGVGSGNVGTGARQDDVGADA